MTERQKFDKNEKLRESTADVVSHLDGAGPLNGYGQEWMNRALTALLDAPVEIYGSTNEKDSSDG